MLQAAIAGDKLAELITPQVIIKRVEQIATV